jgi:hypothetical protein
LVEAIAFGLQLSNNVFDVHRRSRRNNIRRLFFNPPKSGGYWKRTRFCRLRSRSQAVLTSSRTVTVPSCKFELPEIELLVMPYLSVSAFSTSYNVSLPPSSSHRILSPASGIKRSFRPPVPDLA